MNIIVVLGIVAIIAMLIFWSAFRNFVGRMLNTAWGWIELFTPELAAWLSRAFRLIGRYMRNYSFFLLGAALIAFVLMGVSLLISCPILTAIVFVLMICLVILAWFPAGVVLRLFKLTDGVIPSVIKMLISWTAFVGFLGLMCPEVLTWKSIFGAALVGFIFLGICTKIDVLGKVVAPLVVVMCLWAAVGFFWPETRLYLMSWSHETRNQEKISTIRRESVSTSIFGVTLKDIPVLYEESDDSLDYSNAPGFKMGTIVKVVSHKETVRVFNEQAFVEIQTLDSKGAFIHGKKYWVEAESIYLVRTKEEAAEYADLLKNRNTAVSTIKVNSKDSIFTKGTYLIDVNGKTPFIINVKSTQRCNQYALASKKGNGYDILYADGTPPIHDGPNVITEVPYKEHPRFELAANQLATIQLVVN